MFKKYGVLQISLSFVVIFNQVFVVFCADKRRLDEYITHYEPLNYAEDDITSNQENGKSLDFHAFGKLFKLRMKPDERTFTKDIKGLSKEASEYVNNGVRGYLTNVPNSEVFGSIKNGIFEGTIFTADDEYNVRPSRYYFDEPQPFHSIIYSSKDVNNPFLKNQQDDIVSKFNEGHSREKRESHEFDFPDTFKLYDQENNENLRICNVSMQADFLFTEAMGNDTGRAIGEMIYLVRLANKKFEDMSKTAIWGKNFTVRLMIGQIMARNYYNTPKNLRSRSMGVSTYLDFVSDEDFNGFCQAFYFTYRDFEGGITGLSWSKYGDEETQGGICEARRYFIRINENFSVQKEKSFNTGVITYKFYGSFIPPKVGEIAFLRQVGTAFGAPNDPPTEECQPGNPEGKYLMYDKSTNAGRYNNDKFSPCSIRAILKTVNSPRVRDRVVNTDRVLKIYCMETPKSIIERRPKCGDSVVHYHEQCDCGTKEECRLKEPGGCCDPKTCTLRRGATCSVNDGPCCDTTTCSHRSATYECRIGDECAFAATCSNLKGFDNYQCPARVKKGDYKPCALESQVCLDGICSNSVCRRYGLTECQCSEEKVQCHVCCNFLDKCVAAIYIPVVTGFRQATMPIGAPCANDTGYCDIFHTCQMVDLETPMEKVKDLYYKREDVRTLTRKYWWAILLGTAAFIGIVIALLYIISRFVESSIPKRSNRDMQMSLLNS